MAYPKLTRRQMNQLSKVEKSNDGPWPYACPYAPCQVTVASGELIDRVYVIDAGSYMSLWGIDPNDDPAKQAISITDVVAIESSPTRLPRQFANEIYRAGESGMGYTVFTVVTAAGNEVPFLGGNAIDFPAWPAGVGPNDIQRVLPHVGRDRRTEPIADYFWCLYSS